MNPLSRLILARKEELDLTWDDIAERGGFTSHTIVYALARKKEHKIAPRLETLVKLAKALDLPLDIVKGAALEAAGFGIGEVTTTLKDSSTVRIIAAYVEEMDEADKKKLERLAEAFALESRAARQRRARGGS